MLNFLRDVIFTLSRDPQIKLMTAEEARKRKSKNMLQDAAAVGIAALGIKSAYSEWKEMNEQRHSVKELEQRRRKRRKARERREKEARLNALGGGDQR